MLKYLLDTNIVSQPVAKTPQPSVMEGLLQHASTSAIPAPVWHELNYGCQRLPRGKRRRALEAYLQDVVQLVFPILPYGQQAASWHAQQRARLQRAGQPPPYVDGQIAAVAHVHALTLITLNPKDYRGFAGLTVRTW